EPCQGAVGLLLGHLGGPEKVAAQTVVERPRRAGIHEPQQTASVHGKDDDHGADVPHRQAEANARADHRWSCRHRCYIGLYLPISVLPVPLQLTAPYRRNFCTRPAPSTSTLY